jgi:hypothetical protein
MPISPKKDGNPPYFDIFKKLVASSVQYSTNLKFHEFLWVMNKKKCKLCKIPFN